MKYVLFLFLFFFVIVCTAKAKSNSLETLVLHCKTYIAVKHYAPHKRQKIDGNFILVLQNQLSLDSFIYLHSKSKAKLNWLVQQNNTPFHSFAQYSRISKNIKTPLENISQEQAIIGIVRLWAYIDYYFPYNAYLYDWDKKLEKALQMVYTPNFHYKQYDESLKYLRDSTLDSHSHFRDKNKHISTKFEVLPICFNEKGIIQSVYNEQLNLKKNDTILAINGNPIQNICFKNSNINSKSTSFCAIHNADTIKNVLIKRKNEMVSVEFLAKNRMPIMQWYDKHYTQKEDSIYFDNDEILYIDANNLTKNKFRYYKNKLKSVKHCILDLRGYPQNGLTNQLVSFFYTKETKSYGLIFPKIKHPKTFEYRYVKSSKGMFSHRKNVVLMDSWSQSWTETLLIELQNNPNNILIGDYSANGIGQVSFFLNLPGNISFTTSHLGMCNKNGKVLFPDGIKPNHIENTKDTQLLIQKALKELQKP